MLLLPLLLLMATIFCGWPAPASAQPLTVFFEPDTAAAEPGQSVLLSGRIGASGVLRGFTVYLRYDTTVIDLAEAPVAGALIAGHAGLQFNYFDHPAFEPDILEIGGTIFGNDLWQGPGELFRMRLNVRSCGNGDITAPFAPFFVDAAGGYPPVTLEPARIIPCPGTPQPPAGVTIAAGGTALALHWPPVTRDLLGRLLGAAPAYRVFRRDGLQPAASFVLVATVSDTFYTDPLGDGAHYTYQILSTTAP